MRTTTATRRLAHAALLAILVMFASAALGQTPLAWEQTKYFRYDIHNVTVTGTLGSCTVKVMFSVSNPDAGGTLWDIKTAAPFKVADGASFNLDIAWSSTEFTNAGSTGAALLPIVNTLPTSGSAAGAAMPVQVRTLQSAATQCVSLSDCPGLTSDQLVRSYWVSSIVPTVPAPVATGRVALEGRPVCSGLPGCPTAPPFANIPVRSYNERCGM